MMSLLFSPSNVSPSNALSPSIQAKDDCKGSRRFLKDVGRTLLDARLCRMCVCPEQVWHLLKGIGASPISHLLLPASFHSA